MEKSFVVEDLCVFNSASKLYVLPRKDPLQLYIREIHIISLLSKSNALSFFNLYVQVRVLKQTSFIDFISIVTSSIKICFLYTNLLDIIIITAVFGKLLVKSEIVFIPRSSPGLRKFFTQDQVTKSWQTNWQLDRHPISL